MSEHERKGLFWEIVAGRRQPPPAAQLLGFKLREVDPERGTIRVEFLAKPEFANPTGDVQGGFLAAMLDDTLGPALTATLNHDQFAPTVELKVNFVQAAKPGALFGTAQVVARRRTIAFLSGELHNEAGELVATATATARIVTLKEG